MDSFEGLSAQQVGQNSENLQDNSEIVIDSALCEICAPSLFVQPSNRETNEEMQDVTSRPVKRPSARSRKVISTSEDEMAMPTKSPNKRSSSTKRATRGRKTSRATSRKPKSRASSASRSRSRSRGARKSSVSRRGRRA